MHQGKYRFLGFILAITVYLTGLYLDTIQSEDAFFVYDSAGEMVLVPKSFHSDVNNSKICGQEMLGEYGDMEQQSIELHPLFSMLYAGRISLSQGKFYGNSDAVQLFSQTLDGLVTTYMHQSDGKKRN